MMKNYPAILELTKEIQKRGAENKLREEQIFYMIYEAGYQAGWDSGYDSHNEP